MAKKKYVVYMYFFIFIYGWISLSVCLLRDGEDRKFYVELRSLAFEILLLDSFPTIFIKRVAMQSSPGRVKGKKKAFFRFLM